MPATHSSLPFHAVRHHLWHPCMGRPLPGATPLTGAAPLNSHANPSTRKRREEESEEVREIFVVKIEMPGCGCEVIKV